MPHNSAKEIQESSIIGKIISMETLIFVMGCLSLYYGFSEGKEMSIFWGVMIIAGFFLLKAVRKKDWKKHWEDMEREKVLYQERLKAQKEKEQNQ